MIIDFIQKLKKTPKKAKPESEISRIIINVENKEKRIAFLKGGELEDFFIERQSEEPVAGNIYKGIVRNIVPSIQAAFIDIGFNKNGFIHVSDVKENISFDDLTNEDAPEEQSKNQTKARQRTKMTISEVLKEGQEILVQVKKEAIGQKGVRLTSNISLPGRNLVLMPENQTRGISRKITDRKERARLRDMLKSLKIPCKYGIIVRTAGLGVTLRHFEADLKYLVKSWQNILKNIKAEQAPCCVHVELDIALKTLRELYSSNVDELIVDSREEYNKIRRFFRHFFPGNKVAITLYRRKKPIFDVYNIEKSLEEIFQRKVWLKCGGYIVIDQTEALVAIDVNTGRNLDSNNLEKTVMRTNIEAAEEIARQLKLRNMGGIIVIDFIDMAKKFNRKAVLKKLTEALARDKAKTNILPLSELGLVEMTRQRVKDSINQELYEKCPCCKGRGMVKSILSIAIEASRKIKRILLSTREKRLKLTMHPDVYNKLLEDHKNFTRSMGRLFHKKLTFLTDPELDLEQIKVEFESSGKIELI